MSGLRGIPRLRLLVDDQPLPHGAAATLAEVRIQQRSSLPTLCELIFHDPPASLADGSQLVPGAWLRIAVEQRPQPVLFAGEITAVQYGYGPSQTRALTVRAYDQLHRLRKRQPVRTYSNATPLELARELTADLDLAVEAETEDDGPRTPLRVQWRQSNLELLSEATAAAGLYFVVYDQVLHLFSLQGFGEPIGLTYGEGLIEAEVEINADPACRAVQTLAWDPALAEARDGSADTPRSGREVPFDLDLAALGVTAPRVLADRVLPSHADAAALAQAELDRRVSGEVELRATATGDPRLRPGARVQIQGLAPHVCGHYVLTTVTHTLDRRRGFLTRIDTAPPVGRRPESGTLTTIGVVTTVEDPDGLGRVRVTLPSYAGIETGWLQVLSPGAGSAKGLVLLPDRDDLVLVLLPGADPAQGIVLGGLFGAQGPPDAGIADGKRRRFTLLTPDGQRIQLDEEKRTLRLESGRGDFLQLSPGRARLGNNSGSYVELGRDTLKIQATGDLDIAAPGHAVTIRGASIDFEPA
ncbi:phage baseplate assembly protein V [Thiococcus pfennigii]|uniref:phage baseplate assembly protein V n=1 Tax=Thiococcus pfennigii TaxID=1057 RepID=UPI001908488C